MITMPCTMITFRIFYFRISYSHFYFWHNMHFTRICVSNNMVYSIRFERFLQHKHLFLYAYLLASRFSSPAFQTSNFTSSASVTFSFPCVTSACTSVFWFNFDLFELLLLQLPVSVLFRFFFVCITASQC